MTTPHTGIHAQLAPPAAVGLLVVAAAAAHAATGTAGDPGSAAATVAVVAFVVAVIVAMKAGKRIECPRARVRLRALLLASAVWFGTVTAVGVSWGAVEILALMVGALSLQWWSARRIPNPDAASTTPEIPEAGEVDHFAERWAEYVGCDGGALKGSKLTRGRSIESGVRYTLLLVPGKHDRSSVTGVLEKVRGGLGLRTDQDLITEPHPDLPEPHQLLTIVTRSTIKEDILWPGPSAFDPKTGSVALGPFADGIGVARWRVYAGPRIKGGYMQGGTGSGKTRCMESVALSVAASESHPTVIMYADGQGGASSPMLAKYSDYVARTALEFQEMLSGLLALKDHRQDENDLEGWTGFAPTAARPGVLVFMDEQHKFTVHPTIQAMVAELAKEGEKVGIAIIGASQSPLLDAFGGSGSGNLAEAIRSNLLMGNGLIFQSKAKDVKQVFEVDVNPSRFPTIPGYAFLVNPQPGARSAPLRGYHCTDEQTKVWPDRIHWRSLGAGEAAVCGPNYVDRREIAARRLLGKRARVEARRAGMVPAPVPDVPVTRTVPAATCVPDVPQFPVWNSVPMRVPGAPVVDPRRAVPVYVRAAHAIESGEVLRKGWTMPHMIATHLSCSTKWAHEALQKLVELDIVHHPEDAPQGKYYPTGKKLSREVA